MAVDSVLMPLDECLVVDVKELHELGGSLPCDERTLRELYLPPFESAVRDGDAGSMMCAYHTVNGAPTCASAALLQGVLRDEWGFDGFVVSDYYLAVKDTVLSVRNGLEIEMPIGTFYTPLLLELLKG